VFRLPTAGPAQPMRAAEPNGSDDEPAPVLFERVQGEQTKISEKNKRGR
jgi:hypothetical protein